MKALPIDIQTFRDIVQENYYYVDKTHFIPKLSGRYYFLSRPRRFGKSLFLDTLKEAFSGNKELFKGLYLYDNWDWNKKYPIVKFDLSQAYPDTEEKLEYSLTSFLEDEAKKHSIVLEKKYLGLKFQELIQKLSEKYNEKVVILVDEYDKPILDVIEDIEKARRNRDILKKFFEILKPSDPYIKLVFLTGVSRFSKVSIFSGLNQLQDITLNEEFASICGYTEKELESVFDDRLKDFDKDKIREWYNGYSWLGEKVYNPFDILLLFSEKRFRAFWFETATPTFLTKMLRQNKYYIPELENLEVGDEILSNLDVDNIMVENLLFQSGYLTIKDYKVIGNKNVFTLSYPNLEVRISFNDIFLIYLFKDDVRLNTLKFETSIITILEKKEIDKLKDILYSFFASIPHDWYRKNDIDSYEGFYASVVCALLNGAGLNIIAEDNTNKGKIDLSIILKDTVYIIEFKVVENEAQNKALTQLKEKRYYEKYMDKYKDIYLIGIEFSKSERNVVGFGWENISS